MTTTVRRQVEHLRTLSLTILDNLQEKTP